MNGHPFSTRFPHVSKSAFKCAPLESSPRRERRLRRQPTLASSAVPIAIGELIDKIIILEIKESHVDDAAKLDHIRFELDLLRKLKSEAGFSGPRLAELEAELKTANTVLWDVEDALREREARSQFDEGFVSLARLVYKSNDRRAALKKQLNLLFNSAIIEEKSYA